MRTAAALVCVFLGLAGSAQAADFSEPGLPDWVGVYVGNSAGYGWGDATWTFPVGDYYSTGPGTNSPVNPSGGLLGAYIGFNHQMESWVAGIEASAALAGISQTFNGTPFGFPGDVHTINIRDLETITARLGHAGDLWLIYGKGGFATGGVKLSSEGDGVTASKSGRLYGWTLGAGIERMVTSNVVVGLEYDYVNLAGARFTSTNSEGNPYNVDISDMSIHTILARLSLKLTNR